MRSFRVHWGKQKREGDVPIDLRQYGQWAVNVIIYKILPGGKLPFVSIILIWIPLSVSASLAHSTWK